VRLVHDPHADALRKEVRAFIADHAPSVQATKAGVRAPAPSEIPGLREWTGKLFAAGYFGADWPTEWGGLGASDPARALIIGEELARARLPTPVGAGLLAAAALIHFGRQDQKERYLTRIRTGEEIWCQLFSEPEAGSDLAGMRTRAEREGDAFLVSGQKVWTTNGQHAELGYLLARTNPDAAKHAGITAFVVDMRSPGIEVRPLREITGTSDFNEVFFDNVRVPASNVIGEVDRGWEVATNSLMHERSGVGAGGPTLMRVVDAAVRLAQETRRFGKPASESEDVRQGIGRLYAASRTNIALGSYNLSRRLENAGDAADAPLAKVLYSETFLALVELGMTLQGTSSLLVEGDPEAVSDGWWQDAFLYARAYTIAGGTNEILLSMVAERGLGLPKEPSVTAKAEGGARTG
jgi:alkylation response protein AidB-like acyl-CoA dehydrogenase